MEEQQKVERRDREASECANMGNSDTYICNMHKSCPHMLNNTLEWMAVMRKITERHF